MPKGDFAQTPTFLARYDRQVADVLMQVRRPAHAAPTGTSAYVRVVIRAKAVVNPRGAVAMFEALPPVGPDSSAMRTRMIDQARDELITGLVEPHRRTLEGRLASLGHPDRQAEIPHESRLPRIEETTGRWWAPADAF